MATRLVRFSTIPKAPRSRDPRMARTRTIITRAMKKFDDGGEVAVINMTHGYRASAPDLGKLQEMMEPHFRGLSMAEIEKRPRTIERWVFDFLGEWVQRAKAVKA